MSGAPGTHHAGIMESVRTPAEPSGMNRRRTCAAWLFALSAVLLVLSTVGDGASYDEFRTAAVARCEAIDRSEYQSGLYFNPEGYRSFYVRSECFQNTAIQFRDETLCQQVRQRRSLFASSWGYSERRCLDLVKDGADKDRREIEEMRRRYAEGGMRLADFRIERNGNGRDFDIIPAFTGDYGHGYQLTFEILDPARARSLAVLHTSGSYVDGRSNLNLFVRQAELRARFPALVLGRPYSVRASITLDIGFGGQGGYWSNQVIDRLFPASARSQAIIKDVSF